MISYNPIIFITVICIFLGSFDFPFLSRPSCIFPLPVWVLWSPALRPSPKPRLFPPRSVFFCAFHWLPAIGGGEGGQEWGWGCGSQLSSLARAEAGPSWAGPHTAPQACCHTPLNLLSSQSQGSQGCKLHFRVSIWCFLWARHAGN